MRQDPEQGGRGGMEEGAGGDSRWDWGASVQRSSLREPSFPFLLCALFSLPVSE